MAIAIAEFELFHSLLCISVLMLCLSRTQAGIWTTQRKKRMNAWLINCWWDKSTDFLRIVRPNMYKSHFSFGVIYFELLTLGADCRLRVRTVLIGMPAGQYVRHWRRQYLHLALDMARKNILGMCSRQDWGWSSVLWGRNRRWTGYLRHILKRTCISIQQDSVCR